MNFINSNNIKDTMDKPDKFRHHVTLRRAILTLLTKGLINPSFSKIFILLLTIVSLFLTPITIIAEPAYDLDYFMGVKSIIEKNYFQKPSEEKLVEGAIKGIFMNLDPNSTYYTKEEFQNLIEELTGGFVGIGVYIKEEHGDIIITSIIEGGPAYKAGVKPGDKIISVDGKAIKDMSMEEIISLIQGQPGTKIKLGVKRENKSIFLEVIRERIILSSVEYGILDNNIGYIKILQFSDTTLEHLVPILEQFDKRNISNIIIDLRNNPGGLLDEVVNILKLFIPEGPIIHIKYRGNVERTYYSNLKKPKYKLAVLVNERSASASEIFAGAVQDTKVGTIIGVPTYGKGTVQQLISLPYGDGMKLTIAEYLTPNNRNINNKGIKPDIIVEDNSGSKDLQLQKAIESLTP